ncbi:MAG: DNA methyltransferase [Bacteroidales bacterium]|nr:DNA methyltransferase [Bacteroidales bacterium]
MIIEKKKISDLKPAPYNPRKSNEKQEANLKKSLEKFGVVEPIVFNKQTGHIVGGHFRIRELKKLGYKEVDCVIVDLNEDDEKELNIRLNANTGEWDWDTLANEWNVEEISEWGVDLPAFELKLKDIEEDGYEEPDNIETDIQYGDLFKIGNHFLLCGDATKKEDCEKLLQGKKSDLIFTDPPYDLEDSYSQNIFDAAKEDSHIFIMNSDKKLIEIINNGFKIFHGFFAVDFRQAHLIANNSPMTRVDLIAEFRTGRGKFNNLHDGFSTLIECAKIHNDNEKINFGHKQAKKIELPSTFIQHYSNENEIVTDFFGGSGSTMAACEQLKRNCYMMELEPKNCQIIIDRMEKCYNIKSIKIN